MTTMTLTSPPLRDTSDRAQWENFRKVAVALGADADEATGRASIAAQVRPDLDDAEVLLLVLSQLADAR